MSTTYEQKIQEINNSFSKLKTGFEGYKKNVEAGITNAEPANAKGVYGTGGGADPVIGNSPVRRYTADPKGISSQVNDYYAGLDRTAPTEDEKANLREEARKRVQAQVDNIRNVYTGIISQAKIGGEDRLGRTRAVSARSGTLGQDFGNAEMDRTTKVNEKEIAALEAEREVRVGELFKEADRLAEEKITAGTTEAKANTEKWMTHLEGLQTKSKDNIANLAKSGVTLDQMSDDDYKKLLDNSGYSQEELRTQFLLNKPKDQVLTSHTEGSKHIIVYKDPVTGKTRTESIDLGFTVPKAYKSEKLENGSIIFYPEKFDPNIPMKDQIMTFGGGGSGNGGYKFTDTQKNGGAAKAGLTPEGFKALAPDMQNFFVNAPDAGLKSIMDMINAVKTGKPLTADDGTVLNAININKYLDESTLTPAVKEYFKKLNVSNPGDNRTGITSADDVNADGTPKSFWGGVASYFAG